MSETTAPAGSLATAAPAGTASIPTTPTAKRRRYARIALRTVQVLLALFYAFASALPKLIAHPTAVESFDRIGWGSAGMYAIGLLELAGAIALLVPVLQSVAAVSLSALMVGAFIVQVTVFDGQNAATPLILLVPLALIAWARRQRNADLVAMLRRGA
ncbi:DoxX family protein [Streptomyces sp. NPDC049915]|uniref:DoxX family protein n=1 Tax=Streptomyces sp. NPDC049915 TaxID=3155510 RepID=UPI003432C5FA